MGIKKIWGTDEKIFETDSIEVHLLKVKKGYGCSIHKHRLKRNFFYVLDGELKLVHDIGETILNKGESIEIKPPNTHQFVAITEVLAIEVVSVKMEDCKDDILRDTQGGKVNI